MIGFIFLLGLIALFFYVKKELKIAITLFLLPYFLISNLFLSTTGTMAERWWYFPSFGLVLLVSMGLVKLMESIQSKGLRTGGAFIGLGILVWYSFLIIQQNGIWAHDKNLIVYAAEVSPQSAWARANLAVVYFEEKNFTLAKQEAESALKIYDKYPAALNILGKSYWQEGKYPEAENALKKAVEYDNYGRNKRSLYRTLALLNLDQGKNSQAFSYMSEAVKWPPARQKQNIVEIDNFLLDKLSFYKDRSANSYTQAEKEELAQLIKLLRGF
jgi:tetratricopeptide (TPR) repeat protein